MEHYFNVLIDRNGYPSDYGLLTPGEKYETLMKALLKFKSELVETKNWKNLKFSTFLYENYPPPGKDKWVK